MTYAEKLKDPRWQKRRLEILERDDWRCRNCMDHESTLHVHHTKYSNSEPWDCPDEYLVTLCESCHKQEEDNKDFDFYPMVSDLGLTREHLKILLHHVRFRILIGNESNFWNFHNSVLHRLIDRDEVRDFIRDRNKIIG